MPDRSQKALADFISEAQETIDALGRDLMRLEAAGEDPEPDLVNAVFRAAHSLKGLSSMLGVERMARLAHALEDLLDDVRMGRRRLDAAATDLLLEAPEVFSRIIAEESAGEALSILKVAPEIDVVVSDIYMPTTDGIELMMLLRYSLVSLSSAVVIR